MPEVLIGFPRAFVEFDDPADPDQVFRCDLTWLTSTWGCIFGRGCPGIYADRPDDGCCTLGAHFADTEDERRVAGAVEQLTTATWQHQRAARRGGWAEQEPANEVPDGDEPGRRTRLVDGACIFLNRAGFAAGEGCALHLLAGQQGRQPLETKPDVCWQLPLRRQFETVTRPDGSTRTQVSIGEYGRDGWGPGGVDLDWYCSANTEAHLGSEAVYLASSAELVALMGGPGYEVLARLCADFAAGGSRLLRHPADPVPAPGASSQSRSAG
ncbi:hypothetical protein [uncultured Friedmanniella sp.]|uniref:hypothetical protein n=1 Tax=uncultured Friedmanniella sp. TaxID=335381 RepID=UPI0035CAD4E4